MTLSLGLPSSIVMQQLKRTIYDFLFFGHQNFFCFDESVCRAFKLTRRQVFNNPWDTAKVCLPALIYTVQNNLFYLAATHLEAATFMV